MFGLQTRVIEAGVADSPEAVVFLHGAPGSADHWEDLLPRTGHFVRWVAFDLPGYDHCERPPQLDYSPALYGMFVAAAVNKLRIRRAHLVMNDIGGFGPRGPRPTRVRSLARFSSVPAFGSASRAGMRWARYSAPHFWELSRSAQDGLDFVK